MDINRLIIKTKKDIFSKSSGIFSAKTAGEGYDFYELKEYDLNSDARKIDWLISAKMQKPYVRVYQEEKLRNIVIIFLLSGSLFFGAKRLKLETLVEIFLLLGFSALKEREKLTAIEKNNLKYIKNFFDLEDFAKNIDNKNIIGLKPDFKDINELFYKIREKSLIVFLGDFLYEIDLSLFAKKHEVIAFVARDSIEKGFYKDLEFESVDNESLKKSSLSLRGKDFKTYGKNIEKVLDKNYINFRKNGIDFLEIFDIDDTFLKLNRFFIGR
ncbi:DUF58 domain-containing protein [Nitrosophilus kaiyonis]|uniref:DUF58 domain-containing protein n=1 Tax=Nitrosophilus kaiyonis TaxID=2930200 RepID=UPI0024925E29|nr:DUF58 domain-containing protein [Nitrosophilus kaiyonis]